MSRRKRKVLKKSTTLTRDDILMLSHAELINYYDASIRAMKISKKGLSRFGRTNMRSEKEDFGLFWQA